MSLNNKSWKFQDFIAHESDITCVSLGHKSGKVLATGGFDKKVNLWAIGKPNCIISLAGHTTAIQSVRFNQTEEMVCAGSQGGVVKIWDLEAAKIIRTLIGHNDDAVQCVDFNPSGFYLCSSGYNDHSVKFWDMRRKGCIFTFKGHQDVINDVKFSPDGQWIASGSNDYSLKLWDLRKNAVLKDFNELSNHVTHIQFHPNDFLLAGATFDKRVYFWDLENFQLVSTEYGTDHLVTCMSFNSEGESLLLGLVDHLRVIGWEPVRIFDQLPIQWGRVQDISIALNELIGVSFYKNNLSIYIIDLKKIRKYNQNNNNNTDLDISAFSVNQSIRKSFSKGKSVNLIRPKLTTESKTIEESTSSTDLEEDSGAIINNFKDYTDVFRPNRTLQRTPPLNDVSTEHDEFESFDSYQSNINDNESLKLVSSSENNSLQISEPESMSFEVIESGKSFDFERRDRDRDKDKPKHTYNNHYKTAINGVIRKTRNSSPSTNCYQIISRQTSLTENESRGPVLNIQHSLSDLNLSQLKDRSPISNRKKSLTSSSTNTNSNGKSFRNSPQPFNHNDILTSIATSTTAHTTANSNYKLKVPVMMKHSEKSTKSLPVDIYVHEPRITQSLIPSPPPPPSLLAPTSSKKNSFNFNQTQSQSQSQSSHENVLISNSLDRSKGLKFDDFLPKTHHGNLNGNSTYEHMTEMEKIQFLNHDTDQIYPILESRKSSLQIFITQLKSADLSNAIDSLVQYQELSVIADIIKCINQKSSLWSLDITVMLLPTILKLLESIYESYIIIGCDSLRIVLNNFFELIKSTIYSSSGSFGVDIPREERYKKCTKCYETLLKIRTVLETRRHNLPTHLQNKFKHFADLLATINN